MGSFILLGPGEDPRLEMEQLFMVLWRLLHNFVPSSSPDSWNCFRQTDVDSRGGDGGLEEGKGGREGFKLGGRKGQTCHLNRSNLYKLVEFIPAKLILQRPKPSASPLRSIPAEAYSSGSSKAEAIRLMNILQSRVTH
ncbi:hypothetical protein Tco_0018038 [Tanacetum coccineum]